MIFACTISYQWKQILDFTMFSRLCRWGTMLWTTAVKLSITANLSLLHRLWLIITILLKNKMEVQTGKLQKVVNSSRSSSFEQFSSTLSQSSLKIRYSKIDINITIASFWDIIDLRMNIYSQCYMVVSVGNIIVRF